MFVMQHQAASGSHQQNIHEESAYRKNRFTKYPQLGYTANCWKISIDLVKGHCQ